MIGGLTFYFNNSFIVPLLQFFILGLIDTIIALAPSVYRKIRKSKHIENLTKLKKILIINSSLIWAIAIEF